MPSIFINKINENKYLLYNNNNMKKLFFYFLLINIVNIHFTNAQTTCVTTMGADLTYQCVSQNEYILNLDIYYHCIDGEEICPLTAAQILYRSESLGLEGSYILIQTSGEEITPLCPEQADESNCNGGIYPGVMKYTYTNAGNPFLFTLPAPAADWEISFTELYRNPEISNLQNPEEESLYIEAIINNENNNCSDSPQFAMSPVPYYCEGIIADFSQGAINNNNTTLTYTSIQPLSYDNTVIDYLDGYSANNPLDTYEDEPFILNPYTGEMIFRPRGKQSAVIAILVEEHDADGTLKSSIMRNVQIVVEDCNNGQVNITPSAPQYGICPEQILDFTIEVQDADELNTISITEALVGFPSDNLPTVTQTINSNNYVSVNFNWQPTSDDAGNYTLVLDILDDSCPFMYRKVITAPIWVTDAIIIENENIQYCNNGEPMELSIGGGGPFIWSPAPESLMTDNASKVSIQPIETTTYTISNNCGTTQTLTVEVLDGFHLTVEEQIVCQGESINVQPLLEPADGLYSFDWQSNNAANPLNCTICSELNFVPTETGTYTLNVIDEFGCHEETTVMITVEELPTLELIPTKTIASQKGEEINIEAIGDFEAIVWSNGATNTNIDFNIDENTTLSATAITTNGCETTQSVDLFLRCEPPPMPTAFSPNGDGNNDEFRLTYTDVTCFEMQIFDRWGHNVFTSNDPQKGWDGYYHRNGYQQAGRPADIGTYSYIISMALDCGNNSSDCNNPANQHTLKGYITLIR